jgi:hypothetical protein
VLRLVVWQSERGGNLDGDLFERATALLWHSDPTSSRSQTRSLRRLKPKLAIGYWRGPGVHLGTANVEPTT